MLHTLPAQVFVVASVVYTSRSCFHVRKCCIHFPLEFSWSQLLHTLPAQVIVLASVVYTSRSSYRGSKCCIHFPLKFSWLQLLLPVQVFVITSVVYTALHWVRRISKFAYACPRKCCIHFTCSWSAFRNYSPFLFENDFIT